MTSKLAALAKILLLPRRSAPAFVRPLQRIFGTTTDEIGTEPQENDDNDEEQLEEQQQQNKGILLEALMARSGGNLNLNSNYPKYHKGEQVGGPITDPIAKHQLREVRNEYYRSAAINNNNNNNDNDNNGNFNFNTQRQEDDQEDGVGQRRLQQGEEASRAHGGGFHGRGERHSCGEDGPVGPHHAAAQVGRGCARGPQAVHRACRRRRARDGRDDRVQQLSLIHI